MLEDILISLSLLGIISLLFAIYMELSSIVSALHEQNKILEKRYKTND